MNRKIARPSEPASGETTRGKTEPQLGMGETTKPVRAGEDPLHLWKVQRDACLESARRLKLK